MDPDILEAESEELKRRAKKLRLNKFGLPVNPGLYDVSQLCSFYPSKELVRKIRESFLSLFRSHLTCQGNLPCLPWELQIESNTDLKECTFYIVSLRGTKFFMKQEEYARSTEWILHEYFVGINLPFLPTVSLALGAFSCNIYDEKMSLGSSTRFILYEYIKGVTLSVWSKSHSARETWKLIRIIWATVRVLFNSIGFIHQDLHHENIIVVDLEEEKSIKIGSETFQTRYLPKIIDYGRSRIKLGGKVYSTRSKNLMIPASEPEYDLRLLLRDFMIDCDGLEFHRKLRTSGFKKPDKPSNLYSILYLFIRDLPTSKIVEIYNSYDLQFFEEEQICAPLLRMERYKMIPCTPCPDLAEDEFLTVLHERKRIYYDDLRKCQRYLHSLREGITTGYWKTAKLNSHSLYEFLSLCLKNNFGSVEGDDIIEFIFIKGKVPLTLEEIYKSYMKMKKIHPSE